MIQQTRLGEIHTFIHSIETRDFERGDVEAVVTRLGSDAAFERFLAWIVREDVDSDESTRLFVENNAIEGLSHFRMLRSAFGLPLAQFLQQVAGLVTAFDPGRGQAWSRLAERVAGSPFARKPMKSFLRSSVHGDRFRRMETDLAAADPHAVFPTSPYRRSAGHTVATENFESVEASMTLSTFTSIRVVNNVLDPNCDVLRNIYQPFGRCVAVVDQNVQTHFGRELEAYFDAHQIDLQDLTYRAMEVDKGIRSVERLLGDFKQLGVSRNEPVLVIGGGVLTDVAGLACALYHRSTPYVMLSTSLVAGIDAGPSPRTCCDGFGYKNLFGSYHPPILSITDRTFFRTLHPGWVRHGIAEIIKMATVKDIALFEDLERGGTDLIDSKFGSRIESTDAETDELSRRILARAIKSYVEAEYGNLYETHQCRPHAYGHTWSPGFEIPAGLLHGHAVSVGMGFGAFLAEKQGWIGDGQRDRVHRLIGSFDLSLWHDILDDHDSIIEAQAKMIQKRGGHLAAPLPQGEIGSCGYLDELTDSELRGVLHDYRQHCRTLERHGRGVEAHCADVGLEDPSTVGESCLEPAASR